MSKEQLLARITVDPNICHGKPCIRGLRYPVEFLLELLSGDITEQQILKDYPDLEPADLRAAIAYAAQLPHRLARELVAHVHNAVHTSELPAANRTQDQEITALAIRENRIVITKDNDFVTSFLLRGVPPKLLLISTGNMANDVLSKLLLANLAALEAAFAKHDFVELSITAITVHA